MANTSATESYYREAYELASSRGIEAERAKSAYNLSFAYMFVGREDHAKAFALLEEAIAIFRKLGDRASIGRTAFALGSLYLEGPGHSRDDFQRSKQFAHEALVEHRALGNRFDIGWALYGTGLAAFMLGELDDAERDWPEALGMFGDAGDSSGIAIHLSNFAELANVPGGLD